MIRKGLGNRVDSPRTRAVQDNGATGRCFSPLLTSTYKLRRHGSAEALSSRFRELGSGSHIMKTQLLEDIGQSVASSRVSSGKNSSFAPEKVASDAHRPIRTRASVPRTATGVWRQKPAVMPGVVAVPADRQAAPLQEPDGPVASDPPGAAPEPAAPAQERATLPYEHTFGTEPADGAAAKPDPLFDFAPRPRLFEEPNSSATQLGWFRRSGSRYVMLGACGLSAALVAAGGWWLHAQRKDAGSLALVANEFKPELQSERAVRRRLAAKEFTIGANGEVSVGNTAPALAAPPLARPSSPVPPLVLLPPEPVPGSKTEAVAGVVPERDELAIAPKPEAIADEAPAPPPKRVRRSVPAQADPVAKQARTPARQFARAPLTPSTRTLAPDSTMAATLKACRAHGYHATQCIKRACSVTKFGFVCRGK